MSIDVTITLAQIVATLKSPPTWDLPIDAKYPKETISPGLITAKGSEEPFVLYIRPKRKMRTDLLRQREYDGGRGG